MNIGEALLKKLGKKFEPSESIDFKFRRYDISLKTDAEGYAILMFMGKKDEHGRIKGDRYARRLVKDQEGKIIKDHWDYKGKT